MSLADNRTILDNLDNHALSIDVMERARRKIENEIVGCNRTLNTWIAVFRSTAITSTAPAR